MPAPKVREKERSRTKEGKWRKKRSDCGKKRTKLPRPKHVVSHLLGIPEKNSAVIPVKVGPSLKKAVEIVSEGNVSGWVRRVIREELKRKYRL